PWRFTEWDRMETRLDRFVAGSAAGNVAGRSKGTWYEALDGMLHGLGGGGFGVWMQPGADGHADRHDADGGGNESRPGRRNFSGRDGNPGPTNRNADHRSPTVGREAFRRRTHPDFPRRRARPAGRRRGNQIVPRSQASAWERTVSPAPPAEPLAG